MNRQWHWQSFQFNVFNVKKMNIENQCDVSVIENFTIELKLILFLFF